VPKFFVSKRTIIQEIIGGSGPNPSDAFSIALAIADTSPALSDAMNVGFTFPDTIAAQLDALLLRFTFPDTVPGLTDALTTLRITIGDTVSAQSEAISLGITFPDTIAALTETVKLAFTLADTNPALSDSLLSLAIRIGDTNPTLSDAVTFAISLALSDTNSGPTDAHRLAISGFGDANTVPTEGRSSLAKLWGTGSAGTGVTNPTNANGPNDGTSATVSTAVAGAATETLTSNCGNAVANGSIFTSVVFRGWYRLQTVLSTSTAKVVLHSSSAAFTDLTIETLAVVNGDNNHLTTPFSADVSATIDTLAKLQSAQIQYSTTDAVAGTQPAIITADASSLELTGVL
jgi:hypothetical protein